MPSVLGSREVGSLRWRGGAGTRCARAGRRGRRLDSDAAAPDFWAAVGKPRAGVGRRWSPRAETRLGAASLRENPSRDPGDLGSALRGAVGSPIDPRQVAYLFSAPAGEEVSVRNPHSPSLAGYLGRVRFPPGSARHSRRAPSPVSPRWPVVLPGAAASAWDGVGCGGGRAAPPSLYLGPMVPAFRGGE